MGLTTMISNRTISPDAAAILETYAKDQKLEKAIDFLGLASKKVKKEVWVGALALGFSPLLHSIFPENVMYSASFGRTIRKLQTWFDIETDQEKISHAILTLSKVEKVQKVIYAYSCVIEDYTFSNHILKELCRYSVRWGKSLIIAFLKRKTKKIFLSCRNVIKKNILFNGYHFTLRMRNKKWRIR